MAAYAACKRLGHFCTNSPIGLSRFRGLGALNVGYALVRSSVDSTNIRLASYLSSPSRYRQHDCRHISQLVKSDGKRLSLVDTLALVRGLEGEGVPTKQAEAITAAMTKVLNDTLETIERSRESNLSSFKTQVQSSQEYHFSLLQHESKKLKDDIQTMQEHHFSLLRHESEKLKNDIEKMRSELRYEIDKVTAGQRLDLNLEKGRIRDELAQQNAQTTDLTNKLDKEIHALRAQVEAAKYDVIKYCIATLMSISAVGIAVVRILM